jgi:tripartite-type tricarboxylate transporter receptor subunit TctC
MRRRHLLSLSSLALQSRAAWAQQLTMRIIVPFPAGGASDLVARLIAEPLSHELGRAVVVENRGGAGGSIGSAEIARSTPDGLTLGIATLSTHGVNPVVYKHLAYDPVKDFTPIAELALAPGVMVVNPDVPAKSLAEFTRYARSNPGRLNYGSPGVGSAGHLAAEMFKASTATRLVHIPYRGASVMLADLMSGQVQMAFDQVASSRPHVQSGALRALAVSWHERLPKLPAIPTFGELGLASNNEPSWFGLVGPAGLSPALVSGIHAAAQAALRSENFMDRALSLGLFASSDATPRDFAERIRRVIERMQRVAHVARISLDAM